MTDLSAPRRLLLLFGLLIAVANLVGWTVVDYLRFGVLTLHGVRMAIFVSSAVLALYIVLRFALLATRQDAA